MAAGGAIMLHAVLLRPPGGPGARGPRGARPRRAPGRGRPARPGGRCLSLWRRASAAELTRLPRVGPALAARIVADREARGPFGSLDGMRRVPGVGAATARV